MELTLSAMRDEMSLKDCRGEAGVGEAAGDVEGTESGEDFFFAWGGTASDGG